MNTTNRSTLTCKSSYYNNFNNNLQDGTIAIEDRSMKMNELIESKKYTEVSFMIFRTGSCLIIGNCNETVLFYIYDFLINLDTPVVG